MGYAEFLTTKRAVLQPVGFDPDWLPDIMKPFQREAVKIACHRGRCAMFESPGMGKTIQQLVVAQNAIEQTGKPSLIVAPLAVTRQTVREAINMLNLEAKQVRHQSECSTGINVTNYEMLEHFDPSKFGLVALDESGILKGYSGKFRQFATDFASGIDFRLPCTATPAPNDLIELINHAEFLSILRGKEAIAMYFIQDGNTTHKWRLKGHAKESFWKWVASWAVALQKPSDLGDFDDSEYELPPLNMHRHITSGTVSDDFLIPLEAITLSEQRAARRESMDDRVKLCADICNNTDAQTITWCDLNDESAALTKAIDGAVEVTGSMDPDTKADRLWGFANGDFKDLVTKTSIAGYGLNYQNCYTQAFCGITHSYEMMFQGIRRCYRFGQKMPVEVHLCCSENEYRVMLNIERKERESENMMRQIVAHMRGVWTNDNKRNTYDQEANYTMPAWIKG